MEVPRICAGVRCRTSGPATGVEKLTSGMAPCQTLSGSGTDTMEPGMDGWMDHHGGRLRRRRWARCPCGLFLWVSDYYNHEFAECHRRRVAPNSPVSLRL